jgi:hypothetical protein
MLSNSRADIVARFDSEQEAKADADRRNVANSEANRVSFLIRREKLDTGTPPPVTWLRGRAAKGVIGSSSVQIEFAVKGFVIRGDLEGKGRWSQHGKGAVTLETGLAVFRGLIDGNRIYGVRYFKDGSVPLTTWSFELDSAKNGAGAVSPVAKDDDDVHQIDRDDVKAFSAEPGKAVIGLVPTGKDDGSIVTAVPGSNNRVWDATTLAGFKDLADGKKVTDETTVDRMGAFLREQYPGKDDAVKVATENLRAKHLDLGEDPKDIETKVAAQVRQEITTYLSEATPEERQAFLDLYAEKGAPITQLWRPAEVKRMQWYQVPATQDVRDVVRNYQPPAPVSSPAGPSPAKPSSGPPVASPLPRPKLDTDLVGKYFPQRLVVVEAPKPARPGTTPNTLTPPVANPGTVSPPKLTNTPSIAGRTTITMPSITFVDLGSSLKQQAAQTQQSQVPNVAPPPPPVRAPIYSEAPRERKIVTKPGGVIITACAEIDGLSPKDVESATYDPTKGMLTVNLRSGGKAACKLDADDFVVAIRSVFDRDVDPSLSMSYEPSKPGYLSVSYSGPLFKTQFGKTLYQADELLGAIIFNREGSHREVASALIPNYEDMVCESHGTMMLGSRVFLRASGANFVMRKGKIIPRDIQTKVDVEGTRYAADYYHEPLHRLSRSMNDRFAALADQFDDFKDFRRLVQAVALAKWLKRHEIPIQWEALKAYQVTPVDVPDLVPRAEWNSMFNGRNLDGWHLNGNTHEINWSVEDGALTLEPTGAKPVELLRSNYWRNYDLRYTVLTEGPVAFIIRKGSETDGAFVTLNTNGRPQKIELFLSEGAWTALAPGFGRQGKLTLPESKKDELMPPNLTGIRVPEGSKLTLYAAALRAR